MTEPLRYLKAIVFDWAGTTVDHGSRAPATVMQKIFGSRGIPISMAQARGPMGMAKWDHIAAIAALPDVAKAWETKFGRSCGDAEIDAMYADFLPMQKSVLHEHSQVIAGIPEAVATCRQRGLKIGSSTGYTRELMEIVTRSAREQGYQPDCVLCAEDAPRGRPAPYLLYEAAMRLDVYPPWSMINVDDTPVGIQAGRNAGCWCVGITRTGNGVGLSVEEAAKLSKPELQRLCDTAAAQLKAAGAHFVLESVADIPGILDEIEQRTARGERPC